MAQTTTSILRPVLILCAAALGCGAESTPIFSDQTTALGLSIGTDAACWVDLDNDGWTDLVASGAVWHNNSGRSFTKIGEMGTVVAADYDNDGFVDLFSWTQLKLFHNEGGHGFREVPLPALPTLSRGACWGDWNNDGFVDLYIGGYEDWNKDLTYPGFLLLNQGGGSFVATYVDATHRSRGVAACDFMRTGHASVYVSNYRLQPNRLMIGDGTGSLRDRATDFNAEATSPGFEGGHSIGACWGDFDNDGWMDLLAGNFAHRDKRGDQPKSRFLRNMGPADGCHFEDMGTCGIYYQESYATPAAGDYDNDGRLDFVLTTVYGTASFGVSNYPVLFHNEGGFLFSDTTSAAGLAKLPPTYQAAWADYNHDGRLDLACGGRIFANQGPAAHWLEVRLKGDATQVNRSAIGAQVRVKVNGQTLTRQVEAGTGEGNQNDLTLHFGLGGCNGPLTLEVLWPGGRIQSFPKIGADRIIEIRSNSKKAVTLHPQSH